MALSPSSHNCSLQALGFYTRFVTGEIAIPCVISTPYQLPVTIGVRLGGLLGHPNLFSASDFHPNVSDFGMALANAASNASVDPNLVRVLVAPIPPAAATNNGKMSVLLELCHGETGQLLMTLPCADLPVSPPTQQAIPPSSQHPTSYSQQTAEVLGDRAGLMTAPAQQQSAASKSRTNKKQSTSSRSKSSHPQPRRQLQTVAPVGPPPLRVIGSGMHSYPYSGTTPSPTLITFGCFQHDIAGELAVPVTLLNPTSQMFELWVSCNDTRVSYEVRMLDNMERWFPGLSPEEAHAMRVLLVSNAFRLVDLRGQLKVEVSVHTMSGALVISGQCATLYWNGREWSTVMQHAVAVPNALPNQPQMPSISHDIHPQADAAPLPHPVPSMMRRHPHSLPAIQEEGSLLELESESQQTTTTSASCTTSAPSLAPIRFPLATIDEGEGTEPQDHLTPLSPLSSSGMEEIALSSTIQNSLMHTSAHEDSLDIQPTDTTLTPGSLESHAEPLVDPEINPLRFPWRNPALYNAVTEYEVPFYDGGESNSAAGPQTPSKISPSTLEGATVVPTSASRSTITDSPSTHQQQHQSSSPVGVPPALMMTAAPEHVSSPDLPLAQTSVTPQVQTQFNPQVQKPADSQVQSRAATKSKTSKVESKENVAPNAGGAMRTSRETSNRAQPYTKPLRSHTAVKNAAGKATT